MTEVTKSSDEILTELFDSFKAEASVNVSDSSVTPKSPKEEPSRSKKKRKKDKKHKSDEKDKHRKKKKCKRHKKKESSNQSDKSNKTKKKKKRKYSSDSYDSEVEAKQDTKIVTVESCNKENNLPEEKKISEVAVSHISSVVNNFAVACDTSSIPLPPSTGDSILTPKVAQEVPEVKKPQVSEVFEKHAENVGKPVKKLFLQGLDKPKMSIKIGNLKNSQVLEAAEEAKIKADKYEEGEITDETSEESSKLLMKMETETTSENGSVDAKKQKLHPEEKICRKRVKSSDSSNITSSISSGDIKSDEHKSSRSEGGNILQHNEETISVSENLERVNKKSNENDKNTIPDNKNLMKLKKLRQLRERNLDNSSTEDECTNTKKSPPSKSTVDDGKMVVNKSKKKSNKQKSITDSDRSSSSSDSSSSLERTRSSKSKEETTALKDAKPSSKVAVNSISKRNSSPKTKYRKSRDRSVSEEQHSSSKAKRTRSSSRSKLRKSRTRSKSRIRNSRSQPRYFIKKSRSKSRSRQKKSLSRSRERKSRSYSYSRSRARKSRSRSRVRRSRTPKKYYERNSRSVSKSKKSPTPSRVKSKKSRSPSKTKRRSSSPSESRGRRSTSLSRSMKRKSRSRGRKSSRSPSKFPVSKSVARRSSSRSNIRSLSRNRSASKSRHSRSENRRSRSKNKRSSNRRSRSRDSHSKSKQSGVKNLKGNKERSNRSSSKHSYSKLSDSGSDQSESDSKYKASKKKKSKDKKSNSRKHKSKHKDINSRLLALSSTKVESSSEDSSSSSESGDNDGDRKKSNKVRNLSNHKSDDKKSKSSKSKKDLKGKKAKDKDSTKSKIVKEVDLAEDSDILKPKINLKQKIHYSLIGDEPIAMTESEMKILNAKNKLISKTISPLSISSTDLPTKNFTEKEIRNKDFSSTKRIKCKQEEKNMDQDVLKNTTGKFKLEDQFRKLKTDETKKVVTVYSPKNAKIDDLKEYLPIGKSEDLDRNAKDTEVSLSKSRNEDIAKTENLSKKLDVEDDVKSPSDEISAKVKSEEKNKVKVFEKNKNSLMDDMKDLASEIELPPRANSYDSDGQRSDTAMRNIFLGSQSSSNSPDHERPINSYPHSNNDSISSDESESESNDEKTFFGISKDCVDNTYEVGSKTESLVKVNDHSSDSNRSFLDKNITDSDEDITYGEKQIMAVKHISDSIENNALINKENFSFEKSSCPIKDLGLLSVQNFNIQSVECGDSSKVGSIKVSVESIELTKESSQSSIPLSDPSAKGLSTNSKESGDKKKDISSDLSPRKTNSQDFLYDYEKSEIEDDKLDFDEDKSSESDVIVPLKIQDMEIPNQEEKSNLPASVTTVNAEVDIDEITINMVVKNIQEDTNSSVVYKNSSVSNDEVPINEDIAKLANEKIFSVEKSSETVCTENSSSDAEISVSNSSNTAISNTLDIPVPSEEKLNDKRIPIPSRDFKKEFNEVCRSENKLIMHSESKGFDKIDESAVSSENVHRSQFLKNESMVLKTHDSSDNTALSPLPVEDNKQKVTATRIKSISRSRSRSKINKSSSKSKRSRRDTSSSRRSKSKDRSTSRRPKSKDKSSNNRKGRSKSHDKRSRSKVRHSRSNERRRRSKERSLSGSGRSRSKDKSSRLKDRSRERRSRSRRRALSRSKRRSRSRNRSSRSRRRNRSRSRDKKSRSRDRKNRSKSIDKRSRSRGHRPYSRSRERSRSRRHRARSQSSRDKRSRSYSRKERSRTKSKDRSESKDKKSKKSRGGEHCGVSEVKLSTRSMSFEKNSDVRSKSDDKKSKLSSKQEKSKSRSSSKEKEEEKNNGPNTGEEFKATNKIILNLRSPIQSNSNLIVASKKTFSRSKSKEDRSSSEKELESKTCEKSPDRSSKEKSQSPLSFSNNFVPESKKYRSRSNSVSKCIIVNKKTNSPDNKVKRSRTKSPDIKRKKSKTKSPDSKVRRRSRSKSRDKQKNKEKRAKSKDRSESKELKSKTKVMRKSRSRERKIKTEEKSSKSQRKRSRTRSKSKEKNKSRDKRSRSRERRSKSRDKKSRRSRSRSRRRKSDKKDRSRRTRSRSKSRSRKRSKKSRSRSRSKDEFFIDKSKLLEIARKNALSMMKQGAVGTDLNKVTAITAGGKTVDELTDFCKLLSQKDATGQESVSSESSSENESEKPFHHPFQLKERSNNIIMNIRNCASLPVKTHLEKTTENAQQLRLQFPVSSGQLHRKSENEWIPVSPKKTDELKAIMPAPLRKHEEEVAVYPGLQETAHFSNIPLPNSIPHPQPHLPTMPQIGNPWPKPHDSGLFTGTTGARFLSQAELASGQQAWAKKDQLISAQPVSGGMGMSLLQKMGWKPGEGLGKRNEGTLEPLKLQVKMDKRGLVCADEIPQPRFRPHYIPKNQPAKSLEGKHPVSLLVEYCTRKHLNPPMFTVLYEDGPAHKKNFVFKVTVNGVDYQPPNPSPNKKQAKSEAAILCLRALGLLPTT